MLWQYLFWGAFAAACFAILLTLGANELGLRPSSAFVWLTAITVLCVCVCVCVCVCAKL